MPIGRQPILGRGGCGWQERGVVAGDDCLGRDGVQEREVMERQSCLRQGAVQRHFPDLYSGRLTLHPVDQHLLGR